MLPVLLSLVRVVATSLSASCLHAPMTWSADGQWMAYTVVEPGEMLTLKPGWLYGPEAAVAGRVEAAVPPREQTPRLLPRYRIWATQRASKTSVLVADSSCPLSSPTWGPDGHSLVYCRFVPQAAIVHEGARQGRCELVFQEALDHRRVLVTIPDISLDPQQEARFCELRAAWSPDGQYIALPRPGRNPGLLIVLAEKGRILKTLERASLPSWSPESSRLAFIRAARDGSSSQSLEIIGRDFGAARFLVELADVSEPVWWSQDGQSVLVAARRPQARPQVFELLRINTDLASAARAMVLVDEEPARDPHGDPLQRKSIFPPETFARGMPGMAFESQQRSGMPRVSLSFNRDLELCVVARDLEGQTPVIGLNDIRDFRRDFRRSGMVIKKFHPLDLVLRLGSLALHPDEQLMAVRIDTLGGTCPPVFCDLATSNVSLLAPDDRIKRDWLATLVATAQSLLQTVPQPALDGQPIERISLLPAAGELQEQHPIAIRLRRIGKVARPLLDEPPSEQSSATSNDDSIDVASDELRLFFDYLRGGFEEAETDLGNLASRSSTRDARFRLLALRAQILHAQDNNQEARAILDYLMKVQGGQIRRFEETPAGVVLTPVADPNRDWYRYLVQRLADRPPAEKSAAGESPADGEGVIDLKMPVPMNGFDGRFQDGHIPLPQRRFVPGGFVPGFGRGPGPAGMGNRPMIPGLQRPFPPQPPQPAQPGVTFPRQFRRFDQTRPGGA